MEETMKNYFIVSAVGKDRPGLVADVSEVIYEFGGNIEDSRMTQLRNYFSILILFSTERQGVIENLSQGFKRLRDEKAIDVFYSPITIEEAYRKAQESVNRFKISTSGVDHAGIVFKICRLLANKGINIENMETHCHPSAESGTPVFEMDMEIEVPSSISEMTLRDDLHLIANELVIDLVLKRVKKED
jgi:glycine cleavage system transcriptional repressor